MADEIGFFREDALADGPVFVAGRREAATAGLALARRVGLDGIQPSCKALNEAQAALADDAVDQVQFTNAAWADFLDDARAWPLRLWLRQLADAGSAGLEPSAWLVVVGARIGLHGEGAGDAAIWAGA